MSRSLLCVIEFGNYPEQVVERATWLASTLNCNLHLLVCDPVTDYLGNSYVYLFESQHIADTIRQSQDEAVEEMVAKVKAAGVNVEVNRSTERNPAQVIRREAAARKPRYVVKGTHYHTPSERAKLTYEDWELIRDLEYPLWIVKPGKWREPSVIVAAVDPVHAHDKPAHLDRRIIEQAQRVAEFANGKLKVVHCYQTLEEIGLRATWAFKPQKLPVEELNAKIHKEHDHALKVLAESLDLPKGTTSLVPGRAEDVIPAFAESQKASLVVMGALARSKLKQRVIGSTAARALDNMPCDVLVAHARENP
jgi:universal stress protein E